jgi:hypothetical protein
MAPKIPRIPGYGALLLVGLLPLGPARSPAGEAGSTRCARGPDPFLIQLVPTANANGATGTVTLRFADSPFGIAVTADGHHMYDADVRTKGLPENAGVNVLWAATPSLDQVQRVGIVGPDGTLDGTVAFNKFLVFITAEPSPDVERWSGPILMRGLSASGRMHTMAGHGPFAQESCPMWSLGGRDIRNPD